MNSEKRVEKLEKSLEFYYNTLLNSECDDSDRHSHLISKIIEIANLSSVFKEKFFSKTMENLAKVFFI